ncbi:MAG: 4a-hydroxytetrahydrobiopterin dehydratase [Rhodobacteraceae bacterium]|jgi:4a-hydroxytetrahydrobiopterin dehydratase|nr:4a-hydroxytetrahydrobiopterin dehydratase [Paracoccaceae bacterium]
MRPKKLQGADREAALAQLAAAGWMHDATRDAVAKDFRFTDFSAAFGWMTRVALEAEKLDHHPEWLNVYNRVEVVLTTHDVKGLTVLDLDLARAMDRFAA